MNLSPLGWIQSRMVRSIVSISKVGRNKNCLSERWGVGTPKPSKSRGEGGSVKTC